MCMHIYISPAISLRFAARPSRRAALARPPSTPFEKAHARNLPRLRLHYYSIEYSERARRARPVRRYELPGPVVAPVLHAQAAAQQYEEAASSVFRG